MKSKTIIDVDHLKARKYFLDSKNYVTFSLPKYYRFDDLLQKLSISLKNIEFKEIFNPKDHSKNHENVNYKILYSKDGKYDWRPLEIMHPVIYSWLVDQITSEKNWNEIVCSIKSHHRKSIVECSSMPMWTKSSSKQRKSQILTWLEQVETRSVILSQQFDYLYRCDISDCYGSIYTHNIPRAIHGKNRAKKEPHNDKLIGNRIDKAIQGCQFGQTNGIPQGSILMDFLAEIVLAYIDEEITNKLRDINTNNQEIRILRYRDDFRIFCNESRVGIEAMRVISEVLANESMKLNSNKTFHSKDVIMASIKEDKISEILYRENSVNLKIAVIQLYIFSKKHPNSGALKKKLNIFINLLDHWFLDNNPSKSTILYLLAIISEIERTSPVTYEICSAIIAKIIKNINDEEKVEQLILIANKFNRSTNTDLQNIWLHRLLVGARLTTNKIQGNNLCTQVLEYNHYKIWNSKWLKSKYVEILDQNDIIDRKELENTILEIGTEEFNPFSYNS